MRREWSDDDVAYVRDHPHLSAQVIGEHLGRSKAAIDGKRRALKDADLETPNRKLDPWSDEELGFLQDHHDWTAYQVAEVLGRSPMAVSHMRQKISSGWEREREPWTEDEDALVLATPHLTNAQVAHRLPGRTASAVGHRREVLRAVKGVRFDEFVKIPNHVGARPLVAKSCSKCGLLLAAVWFAFHRGEWHSACKRCEGSGRAPRPRTSRQVEQTRTSFERRQAMTLEHATNRGQPWTESDHRVLADPDLTLVEKALSLGRTYSGTVNACAGAGYGSKVGLGDPERDQWYVDNPNAVA